MFRNAEETLTICQWNDNSDVRLATNITDNESLAVGKCKWWSKQTIKDVTIPQPVIPQKYNKGMGEVDLFDQFCGKYRVTFRK